MISIIARLRGTPHIARADVALKDLLPLERPEGFIGHKVGPKAWAVAKHLEGPAVAGAAKLQVLLIISARDWDGDGVLEPEEMLVQALVGNWELDTPSDVENWDLGLLVGGKLRAKKTNWWSHAGAPRPLRYGKLTYDPAPGWEARISAGVPTLPGDQLDAFHAALDRASVSDAIPDTHQTGGTDLTMGCLPAAAALVLRPAQRARLLEELWARLVKEASRPNHFIKIFDNGSFRPYEAARDGGDLWEGGPTTKRIGEKGDPWGWSKIGGPKNHMKGGDPEHFTRVTDELHALAMATGDRVAAFLLHGPLQSIQSEGWKSWQPRTTPKRPLSARMVGWVGQAFVQGVEVHGKMYDLALDHAMRGLKDFAGTGRNGVPYALPTKAINGHAEPSVEQLRWHFTEYAHGPRRAWPFEGVVMSAWSLLNGPLQAELQKAGQEDHGDKWAYWASDKLEPGAPADADPLMYGIGVMQVFCHSAIWMSATALRMLAQSVEAKGGVPSEADRALGEHLVKALLVGRHGHAAAGIPPAPETFHRDVQLRSNGIEEEPHPYETLDSYPAEALAHAARVLDLAPETLAAIEEAAGAVVTGSKGARAPGFERAPNDFWESLDLGVNGA